MATEVDKKVHLALDLEPIAMGTGPTQTVCGLWIDNPNRVVTDLDQVRREIQCGRCRTRREGSERSQLRKVRALAIAARDNGTSLSAEEVLAIVGVTSR